MAFALLIVVAIFYRLIPMPTGVYGFTPMFAMAIFGGSIFSNNKKYAFALPLFTFFLSDVLFEVLYRAGKWSVPGFYQGQLVNYILFALTVCVGFLIKRTKTLNIAAASIAAPTLFYILLYGLRAIIIQKLQQDYNNVTLQAGLFIFRIASYQP